MAKILEQTANQRAAMKPTQRGIGGASGTLNRRNFAAPLSHSRRVAIRPRRPSDERRIFSTDYILDEGVFVNGFGRQVRSH
jgi:hypothetical protein